MIRVLLAEDQALVRDGLRLLLELQGDLQVTAVADGAEAVARAAAASFDVALLDVRMPRMDGIACLRRLQDLRPQMPVLMLTTYDDDRLVRQCLAAGAAAYLLKDMAPEDLANAIRLVVYGGGLIPGDLAGVLARAVSTGSAAGGTGSDTPPGRGADRVRRGAGTAPGAPPSSDRKDAVSRPAPVEQGEPLTPRQVEVLQLLARGLSNREIAARLHLSEGTVKNLVSEIYARLQVRDRVQAVLRARGWLGPGGTSGL
ncbi:response regulator transcription factor [Thermaerobacter sp. PB12/4term]|uniref:response regulator transcription factor n=1 Tax=Thermaerobacter sp. PB12/4term TaxID=2293838 RepID=UPI000E32A36F|nr:response regulator transcription factor [Thermaerobacter sp. PB12/4term]QIA27891.1 response regulator transcription factor [Thermaerobacter sp. PB12/4term]